MLSKTTFTKLVVVFTILTSYLLSGQAYQYAWMKGAQNASLAVYGTQGVASPNNTPGSGSGGITWTDQAGNLWLYGGNDLWKYSPATNNWTWMNGPGISAQPPVYGTLGVSSALANPGTRGGSASWADASGNLWLFGGSANGNICNDLWRYNISSNQWTWMGGSNTPSQTAVYGSITVPSSANIPGASSGFVSWKDASGNFWLYDAIDGTEVWKYNPSTSEWAWMSGTNAGTVTAVYGTMGVSSPSVHPGERWTSGVGDASGNLYVFGGKDYTSPSFTGRKNDLWKYDIGNNQWTWIGGTQLPNTGAYGTQGVFSSTTIPTTRYGHTLWADNNNKLWVFGGEIATLTGNYQWNDTWCFDLVSGQWAWMNGSNNYFSYPSTGVVYGTQGIPAAANTPGCRSAAACWSGDQSTFWMFSGYSWTSSTELWKFNGCSASPITINSSQTSICSGQTTSLTVSGPSTFTWNAGQTASVIVVTPFTTTTYSVNSADGLCTSSATYTQVVIPNPLVTINSSTVVSCSGDPVILNAAGATSYNWSSGQSGASFTASPLSTTVYTVTGTTSGCSSSAIYTQSVNPNPTITVSSSASLICSGNTITLNASGAASYVWDNGQSTASLILAPVSTTYYVVFGTTNGCSSTGHITQQVSPLPVILVSGVQSDMCKGQTASLTASGAHTYTWSNQGLTSSVVQVSPAATTVYTVTGTNVDGCVGAKTVTVVVSECVGLTEFKGEENSFSVNPNPASSIFTIKGSAGQTLKIINAVGQLVLELKLESETVVIQNLSPGVYYCIGNRAQKALKFMIQ